MKLPILLVTFVRLDTTLQVLKEIRKYRPSKLYISSDYGREGKFLADKNMSEKEWVDEIRKTLLQSIDWECEVKTQFLPKNLGCKEGVSSAISWFFENEEMGIILEDDTLPNQSFFYFCEEMLERYKDNNSIFMVSGWSALDFDQEAKDSLKEDYFFSKYNHIWGWASWRRAWQLYQKEFFDFENEFAKLDFDSKEEKKVWYKTFKAYSNGKINTWDYPWTYTIWKNQGVSIYPKNNMIQNIGLNRSDATHTGGESKFENMKTYEIQNPLIHPTKIARNQWVDMRNFNNVFKLSIIKKIKQKIFRIMKRFFK